MPDYDRYVGDSGVTLTLDVDPGVDLTGGTPVIKIKKPDGELLTKAAAQGVTLDAPNRTASYVWESNVLDQGGAWDVFGHVTIGSLIVHMKPVTVLVGWVR